MLILGNFMSILDNFMLILGNFMSILAIPYVNFGQFDVKSANKKSHILKF
jgi:hypothetical protein